jgi:hypothetical protein
MLLKVCKVQNTQVERQQGPSRGEILHQSQNGLPYAYDAPSVLACTFDYWLIDTHDSDMYQEY